MYQLATKEIKNVLNQHEINLLSENSKEKFHEYKKEKLILDEQDLKALEIRSRYDFFRSQLYNAEKRKDCILIQASAFVVNGAAFLLMGVGGIDFLDSLSQLEGVDGIIGNGNALFLSKDFKYLFSANSSHELKRCYELEGKEDGINFIDEAPVGPLIFILRSFRNETEFDNTKKKVGRTVFNTDNTFAGKAVRFSGSMKSRLRAKFVATSTVVHCARRPTLEIKECLFDSKDNVFQIVNNFQGYFSLIYTKWSQELCDVIGMKKTRLLGSSYNPTDPITPELFKIAKEYLSMEFSAF